MKIEDLLSSPFSFNKRKVFTPCETRPLWKTSLIILILGTIGQNNKRCSLKKIHTANWLIKSSEHFHELMEWSQKDTLFAPNIRLDPSVDRAIEMIAASGYVAKVEGKISLTEKGESFFKELNELEIMTKEKEILILVKRHLSEAAIERLFKAN